MSINKAFVLKKKEGDCDKTQVQVMMRNNNTYLIENQLKHLEISILLLYNKSDLFGVKVEL